MVIGLGLFKVRFRAEVRVKVKYVFGQTSIRVSVLRFMIK